MVMKHILFSGIFILLWAVSGFCQTPPVSYTLSFNLSIYTNGAHSGSDANRFRMNALINGGEYENYWAKDWLPKSSTQSASTTITSDQYFQGFRFYGQKCYEACAIWCWEECSNGWNDWKSIPNDYKSIGYYKSTFNNVVPQWTGNLTVEIKPVALNLTYNGTSGKENSTYGGALPSKNPITLSCTEGYPEAVYKWQYLDGHDYVWTTEYGYIPVPYRNSCYNNYTSYSYYSVNPVNPVNPCNLFNDHNYDPNNPYLVGSAEYYEYYSYYTSEEYLKGYYDYYEEYDRNKFVAYLKNRLGSCYCEEYAAIPVKMKVDRWKDFPAHLNNQAKITFTGEELLGTADFVTRYNSGSPLTIRVNTPATSKNMLTLDLQQSAPNISNIEASTPCAGEKGSLTLYFDRPLNAKRRESLHIAYKKDNGMYGYSEGYCNISTLTKNDSYTISGLDPGSYEIAYMTTIDGKTVNIRSATFADDPKSQRGSALITTFPEVKATISPIPARCYGASDGMIVVTPTSGSGDYSLLINNTPYSNLTVSNLPAGAYTVRGKDGRGCMSEIYPATISEPLTPLSVNDRNLVAYHPSCYGLSNGSITVQAEGGTSPYGYTLSGDTRSFNGVAGTAVTFDGLPAGAYTIWVTDANGCRTSASTTLTQPAPLTATITSPQAITCNGGTDGSLSAAVQGGTPGAYRWWYNHAENGWQACGQTPLITGREAGHYRLEVTYTGNCTATTDYILIEPEKVHAAINIIDVKCFGESNGEIIVQPAGGSENNYYVDFYNGHTLVQSEVVSRAAGYSFTGLPKGEDYRVILKDDAGCAAEESYYLEVGSADAPVAIAEVLLQVPAAYGEASGTVSLSATGGVGAYTYTLQTTTAPVQTLASNSSGTFTGLGEGSYTVGVADGNQCATDTSFYLSEPVWIQLHRQDNILCYGASTGALEIKEAEGGLGGYTYQWHDAQGPIAGATSLTLTNQPAGAYRVVVTDRTGLSGTATYELTESTPITYGAQVQPVNCYGGADGVINVRPQGGAGTAYSMQLYTDAGRLLHDVRLSPGDTRSFEALKPAHYRLTMSNDIGCVASDTLTVVGSAAAPAKLSLLRSADPWAYNLNNGSISITAEGGAAPYALSLSGHPLTTGLQEGDPYVVEHLYEGIYHLVITDKNYHQAAGLHNRAGCVNTLTVQLVAPPALEVRIEQLAGVSCKGMHTGSLQAVGSGGIPAVGESYAYEWYQDTGAGMQRIASGSVAGQLAAGTYTVKIIDANGIEAWSTPFELTEPEELLLTTKVQSTACGQDNGAATAVVTGGTMPYSYEWSSGHQTMQADSLSAGRYMVYVSDSHHCGSKAFAVVPSSEGMYLEEQVVHPACYNAKDGSIHLQMQGGEPPYRYLWDNGQNTAALTGLSQGTYRVQVSDTAGCKMNMIYELQHPEKLTVEAGADLVMCKGQEAVISAVASKPVREYNWYHNGVPYDNRSSITATGEGQYRINVFDNDGCPADTSVTVKFLDVDLAADFLVSAYATVGETLYAVDISWPQPDSIRWILPENNVTLLSSNDHSVQVYFSSTGTFEVGMLSYKQGCYAAVYKTVEVVDEKEATVADAAPGMGLKSVGVYPNPSNGYFNVKIELEKDDPVTLKLFTMDGLLLKTEQLQGSISYHHLFTVPGGITPGIYFLQIITPDSVQLIKVLIY